MNSSSSSGRPKTRNQWIDYYAEFNEEKKRIRSKISESGSSSERVEKTEFKKMKSQSKPTVPTPAPDEDDVVLIVEEDETSDEDYSMVEKKDMKEDNNKNKNQIRFLGDDGREEDVVLIREEDVVLIEEDDDTIDAEVQEKEKALDKKKKQKKEQRGRDISFEIWEASDDPSLAVVTVKEKTPPKQGVKKTVEEKQKGKAIPRKKTALKEDGHGGIKRTKEDQKRKEKENGGDGKRRKAEVRSEKKSGDESEEDEVVCLGTCFSSSGAGLNPGGSVSGSKVGSVGGMSPDMVTYDEVASSTSKKINESAGVVSSEDSDASSSESEDSEEDDDSDSDDDSEEDDDTSDTSDSDDDSEDDDDESDDDEDVADAGGKQESGVCSRLRSQANPKKEENQNGEKAVEKKQTGTSKGKQNLNVRNILLNTMLDNEGKFNDTLPFAEENVPKQLPLKFRFWEEDPTPPPKQEWEMDVENLFADLQMGRLQSEAESSTQHVAENRNGGDDARPCWNPEGHFQILDEEIGIVCKHCSVVFLESRNILPAFAKRPQRRSDRNYYGEPEHRDGAADFDLDGEDRPRNDQASVNTAGTVWDLVPRHIRAKMYPHQRQGFEFIWKNVAGDIQTENLRDLPLNGGKGCIISHAPGTGKTGLTVVFLQSFMKLFPMCRPVVIAPRSMLLTWESEFKKWDVDLPFHNLNSHSLSGKEDLSEIRVLRKQPRGKDVNRLVKLYSWAKGSGILGLTYRLFEQLAGSNSYEEEDEKLRKVILNFPGLLVLDEGHTPRNEETLVWKALSRVETPRRIILSGTPFQNNFHELYNTMSLVCPEFSASRPSISGKHVKKRKAAKQNWASITGSIFNNENEGNVEELKQMIAPFVHVHKGTILQEKLPGLHISQLYLKLTPIQQKLQNMISTRHFIEQDNWMTLISVHPSLAPEDEGIHLSKALELDPKEGVKTRFVFELITLCDARSERVIIFSRLLEPLTLIKKQLLSHFQWTENREILYMDGAIDVRYRQDRIRAFNDPESEAKVLLASTAACCEGINLIGGSRIILLDVVWNPSVTRQAISRAYRLGQTKVVHVYNLISSSFEARKYACQAKKDRMSELVFAGSEEDDHHHSMAHIQAGAASKDMVLEAMLENPSLCKIFERVVHQPKNHQVLWS